VAELKQHFPDAEITMIRSGGGVFEVQADGEPAFSKKQLRRHAEPGEIVALLRKRGR